MLLKWFICVAVFNIFPVHSSTELPTDKRSDHFVQCDDGWFQFREKCFKIYGKKSIERTSWDKAETRCKQQGGDLATIQSKEESDFIFAYLLLDAATEAWIGLHDRGNFTEFVWNDGSAVNYTNWAEGEPSNYKYEDCVRMTLHPFSDRFGHWADLSCNRYRGYICQKKINRRRKSPNPQFCPADEGGGLKFMESCYHVVTENKTWEDAEQHCIDNYKGHLATVLDRGVDLHLDYALSNFNRDLWIGMKTTDDLQPKWASGWFISYNRTDISRTEVPDGTCVLRRNTTVWPVVPCSKEYSFLCEVSKVISPVLKPTIEGSYCPPIPNDWLDLGGDFCYFIENQNAAKWQEALFQCQRRGGNLLSLHSKKESDVLETFLRYIDLADGGLFIGLIRQLMRENVFKWSDGTPLDWENWSHYEPNNEAEKCVELGIEWNDVWCNANRGYICSVRKVTPNGTFTENTIGCTTGSSNFYTALIAVTVCMLLVIILLGVAFYGFRYWDVVRLKASTAVGARQISASNHLPKCREDGSSYETMA